MLTASDELAPLTPAVTEIAVSVLAVAHVLLLAVVVVQVVRGRLSVPYGLLGYVALLFVPVVGPLLTLTWQQRLERRRITREGSRT